MLCPLPPYSLGTDANPVDTLRPAEGGDGFTDRTDLGPQSAAWSQASTDLLSMQCTGMWVGHSGTFSLSPFLRVHQVPKVATRSSKRSNTSTLEEGGGTFLSYSRKRPGVHSD